MSALIVFAALAGCGSDVASPPDDVRPVRAEQVAPSGGAVAVRYAGEVRARHETPLAFRVGGRVTRRAVDVGAAIEAGQTIATLDPQDYALALQSAQAQLAAAEAEARLAQQDLQRFSALRARNFISEAELDRRRAAADSAQARVQQLRAEVARQGNQQAYARLRAPHAGVVTEISLEPGQIVAAGQTVAQLARSGELEVRIDVPENALATLRAAKSLTVRLWSTPDKAYAGRLRELSPAADPVSRTYRARVSVLAADAAVKLGMSATVEAAHAVEPGLSVAQSALFQGNGRPQVWVVDVARGTVAPRDLRLGALVGERATVVAGLKPGEWVVTAGVHKLAPGQKVRLAR
jgi:multidrug efflux system membrane fusion protein